MPPPSTPARRPTKSASSLANGNVKEFNIEPPLDEGSRAGAGHRGARARRHRSDDRLAAARAGHRRPADAGGLQQRTLAIFDGRLRYDLQLAYKRMEQVKARQGLCRPGGGLRGLFHAGRRLRAHRAPPSNTSPTSATWRSGWRRSPAPACWCRSGRRGRPRSANSSVEARAVRLGGRAGARPPSTAPRRNRRGCRLDSRANRSPCHALTLCRANKCRWNPRALYPILWLRRPGSPDVAVNESVQGRSQPIRARFVPDSFQSLTAGAVRRRIVIQKAARGAGTGACRQSGKRNDPLLLSRNPRDGRAPAAPASPPCSGPTNTGKTHLAIERMLGAFVAA